MLQPERGQVKLAAYANSGLLTVHVIQARNLQSKWQEKCNGFIKVTLHPEDEDPDQDPASNKCKTEVLHQNNQPQFDEKFSFELLEEDLKRRILISAWHHEEDTGHNEFLGCMSFGIQHIVSRRRVVNGWYYLLTEKLGKRKHLQVNSQRNIDYDPSVVPQINQDLAWMEPCVFVLKKESSQEHGIEVSGAFPAIVHSLHQGSPGESIGLQPGDRIVRINGFNVSRSTEESVSRILRSHETQIILEIQRPRKQIRGGPAPPPAGKSKVHHPHHHNSLDIQEALDEENYMDRASLMMQAKFNSELNVHQQQMHQQHQPQQHQQNSYQFNNTNSQNNPHECCGHNEQMNDSRMTCCGNTNNGGPLTFNNDLGRSMCSVNMAQQYNNVNGKGNGFRQPLSQCSGSINNMVAQQDGYYSEGQPMRMKPSRSSRMVMSGQKQQQHLESGYISEGQSMRRTSTRTSSFRDNGYYSEGQPMMRGRRSKVLAALQEEESGYFNEANTIQESCCVQQQQDVHHHHVPAMHPPPPPPSTSRVKVANCNQRSSQSVGVTANSGLAQDGGGGYCSEGQPRSIKRLMMSREGGVSGVGAMLENVDGYYSEGQAMRTRPRPSGGSVCGGGYNHGNNNGALLANQQQQQHREMYTERLYPQGMPSQQFYQEHDDEHSHEQNCPMHLNRQPSAAQQHHTMYHEENCHQQTAGTSNKRDKVSAWLDNIPHPKEMHHDHPSVGVPNPFPELSGQDDHHHSKNQRPKPVGCTGGGGKQQQQAGLDPIYEEPEITSISMLLEKRRQPKQLEPIAEEAGKENAKPPQPIKKGSRGAVSLFGLCGGIASKKKKKEKTIKL